MTYQVELAMPLGEKFEVEGKVRIQTVPHQYHYLPQPHLPLSLCTVDIPIYTTDSRGVHLTNQYSELQKLQFRLEPTYYPTWIDMGLSEKQVSYGFYFIVVSYNWVPVEG